MKKKININEYEQTCKKLLEDPEIRFAGLLDEFGTLLTGGYHSGTIPRLSEEQHKVICHEISSRVAKRKKFDSELGRVKYSASRREHVVIMSFPVYDKAMMIVAEPNVNIDRLSYKIINILGDQWSNFVGQ